MWGKILVLVILIVLVGVVGWFVYQNLPGEPKNLSIVFQKTSETNISYGATPMFMQNIRFNHKQLSYMISDSCQGNRRQRIVEAFSIIEQKVGLISFFEVFDLPDIFATCSRQERELEKNLFIAGEGGPTKIVNTSLYNVILKGKILLYKESDCSYPVVELHELLHVLGFDHSSNPKNIMYNYTNCDQKISPDIIQTLVSLYSVHELADLYIKNVNATKKGRYLDFGITVKNQGLKDVENVILYVGTDSKEIKSFSLEDIPIGAGRILTITNLKLPLRSTSSVSFIVDKENEIQELDKENNKVEMSV